jgi:3-hydroxyisobutyrate dehydrogenase
MGMSVAVLGAGGTMGFGMASNLARAGLTVRAWNRSAEKAEALASDGALLVKTPADAADGADIVLTMMSDTDAVVGSMTGGHGAAEAMRGSAVWLQMSTIGVSGTQHCADLAASRGVGFVDAPVLGSKQAAADGTLVVLASGPERLRGQVQPVFDAVGHKTMWVGDAGAGSRLKLVVNSWVLSVTEAGAETIALAEGLGLAPELFLEAIAGGSLDLPYLRMKAKAIADRNFEPAFRLGLAAKDGALIEQAARGHGLDLPLFTTIAQRLEQGSRQHPDDDMCATYLTSAPRPA